MSANRVRQLKKKVREQDRALEELKRGEQERDRMLRELQERERERDRALRQVQASQREQARVLREHDRKLKKFRDPPEPVHNVIVGDITLTRPTNRRIVRISMDCTATCMRKLYVDYVDSEGCPHQYCSWDDGCYGGEIMIEPGATEIKAWVDNVGLGDGTRISAVNRAAGDHPWLYDETGASQTEVFCIADGDDDVDLVLMVRGAIYHSWVHLVADVARDPSLPFPDFEYWPATADLRRPPRTQYHCYEVFLKNAATDAPDVRFGRAFAYYLTQIERIVADLERLGTSSHRVQVMLRLFKGMCTIASIGTAACIFFPPGLVVTAVVSALSFIGIGLTSLYDIVTGGHLRERLRNAKHEHRKLLLGLHKAALAAGQDSAINNNEQRNNGAGFNFTRVVEVLHAFNSVTAVSAKTQAALTAMQLGTSAATTDARTLHAFARTATTAAADTRAAPAVASLFGTITQVCAGISVALSVADFVHAVTTEHRLQGQIDSVARDLKRHFDSLSGARVQEV